MHTLPLWLRRATILPWYLPYHLYLCGHWDMLLWLIKFSWASLQIPTPKPLPAILIVLLSPLFFPCTYFLDLEEPLILYSDLACLDHTQPFLEPEQRELLQAFVKIVEPCSLNYVQTYNKGTHMSYLISLLFFFYYRRVILEKKNKTQKQNLKNLFQVNLRAIVLTFTD